MGGQHFLLQKRGLYYRTDSCGYTGIKDHAGRYLETDASPENGVTAIHEDEAADFSPACFDDLARAHLQDSIKHMAAVKAELLEALRECKLALEYGAGCDEGVTYDVAEDEILRWVGSPAAVAYTRAIDAIAKSQAPISGGGSQ